MHPSVKKYIEKVKNDILEKLDLCEKEYCPTIFKAKVNREQFPSRDYSPNLLGMITKYKYLVGFEGSEDVYESISEEFWSVDVVEDGEDYIIFRRFLKRPIHLSDEEFLKLMQFVQIDPNGPFNATDFIVE